MKLGSVGYVLVLTILLTGPALGQEHTASDWFDKGGALYGLGDYTEAIRCYDEAIRINPQYTDAWNNKGLALGDLGRYDEAIDCYDKSIKIDPEHALAWKNKGGSLCLLGKYDEAIACCDNPSLTTYIFQKNNS
ncbi:MAG: tetratricopeptide repeat protein [Euryarchaeota archaeon]|nr:tetratricopeptide repeat protein [Euryarchaeota archaeon]